MDIPIRARYAGETALSEFVHGFQKGATVELSNRILTHVNQIVDQQIQSFHQTLTIPVACKAGCNYCCRVSPVGTIAEILNLAAHIREEFSDGDRADLLARIDAFGLAEAEARYQRVSPEPCPLLVDGHCSVYEKRPLLCRMMASQDAGVCRSIVENPTHAMGPRGLSEQTAIGAVTHQGIQQAMSMRQCANGMYGVIPSLRYLLDHPEAALPALKGQVILPVAMDKSLIQFPIAPGDLHGQVSDQPKLNAYLKARTRKEIAESIAGLDPSDPILALTALRLPESYSSQEELLEERARVEAALDRLIETHFDSAKLFAAHSYHNMFFLPYQGLSVRETIEKHGRWVAETASRALPHLTEPLPTKRRPGKIRVGYIGTHLTSSNGGSWAQGWLSHHSSDVETFAFFLGDVADQVTTLFRTCAANFFWLRGNVQRAAEFIRSLDLDVLIHPALGMDGLNHLYASLKLARIQCTGWGHPVTSGLPTIDFYLSSDYMEPEDGQAEYTEKLIQLPRSGLFLRQVLPAPSNKSRGELGLPNGPFIFMAQRPSKWTPGRDHLLKEIQERTGMPIVFALQSPVFEERLKRLGVRFHALGVLQENDFDRVLQLATFSLDPPDWSGGNTTVAALSLGTPVVTLPGPFMRGRHSLAFLRVAGGEGLIAKSEEDFVEIAASEDRQKEAMANLRPFALYEDGATVDALDWFIVEALKNLGWPQ
jgi:hypothetical protein